jgi:CHASE2 domain-containing sensor protein
MKRSSEFADLFMPWAGLVTGVVALGIAHQFGSDGVFDHCLSVSPVPLIGVCLLAIAATFAGGFASWRILRSDSEAPARKVIAVVSVGSAALFVLAMILPIIAALVIPPCFQ